jgi:hypothetical protein
MGLGQWKGQPMRSRVLITAVAVAAAVALVGQSPASAQGPAPGVRDPRVLMEPPAADSRYISVTVAYNFALPVKPNDVDSQRASMEQGRTMLYQMTAKECDMLLATMASSCQLERLQPADQRRASPEAGRGAAERLCQRSIQDRAQAEELTRPQAAAVSQPLVRSVYPARAQGLKSLTLPKSSILVAAM